ncbi:MAG TPA: pyridoxamine 5'-phosphate oxidase family protein [Streptosporangiaceae bacterium]|nr:pyridoxamine 5'-phosphate oxidase family protein [Streptosporangiaceae bacterium]
MSAHPVDHAGLEVLGFEECLIRLASVPVGRVGFVTDGELLILPVNHVVDGQDLVFRTAQGSKLSAAAGQDKVTFEADAYDDRTRAGWSVLVTGRAELVYEEAEVERLGQLGLHPWPRTVERPFWARIRPSSVTGRQIPQQETGFGSPSR